MTGDHVCISEKVIINDNSNIFSTTLCEDFYNYVYGCKSRVIKILINMCFKEAVPGSEYVKIFIIICMYVIVM